jgi:hypothetical protein
MEFYNNEARIIANERYGCCRLTYHSQHLRSHVISLSNNVLNSYTELGSGSSWKEAFREADINFAKLKNISENRRENIWDI